MTSKISSIIRGPLGYVSRALIVLTQWTYHPVVVLAIIGILSQLMEANGQRISNSVRVSITHWNDVQAQFERFKLNGNLIEPCYLESDNGNLTKGCFGGFTSLVTAVKSSKTVGMKYQNELRFSPGNFLGGEGGWLSVLTNSKGNNKLDAFRSFGELVGNHLKPHAITLGYHDLRFGWSETLAFLSGIPQPVVVSNFEIRQNKSLGLGNRIRNAIKKFHRLDLKTNEGVDFPVGVVGFVDPSYNSFLDPENPVELMDVVLSLKSAIKMMANSTNQEIKFVIVLGTGDVKLLKSIVDAIPEVKLIITGVSPYNTSKLLYSPMKYKKALILSAGQYGSSIGKVSINMNPFNGEITGMNGSIILNSWELPSDENATISINELRNQVFSKSESIIIGNSEFGLSSGPSCHWKGCHLGNVVTDAMAHCGAIKNEKSYVENRNNIDYKFRKPILAIWNGGAISNRRHDIESFQEIRKSDIHEWMPFLDSGRLVSVKGLTLMKIFQMSAIHYKKHDDLLGSFLHVSSDLRLHYDTSGETVDSLLVNWKNNSNEFSTEMKPIDGEETYLVVVPDTILRGSRPFEFLMDKDYASTIEKLNYRVNVSCLVHYVEKEQVLSWGYEQRIFFKSNDDVPTVGFTFLEMLLFCLLLLQAIWILSSIYITGKIRLKPVFTWGVLRFRSSDKQLHIPLVDSYYVEEELESLQTKL